MPGYILRRLGQGVIVLWGVTLVVFLLIHIVPGDPGRVLLGLRATPAAVRAVDDELGLNHPLAVQYLSYLGKLLRGNLGTSFSQHVSVVSLIGPRLVPSMLLVAYAVGLALSVAVPLAIIAALRADGATDHVVRFCSVAAYAMPPFWFGLLLALLFGLKWNILPTSGYDGGTVGATIRSLTLPAVTMALYTAPVLLRLMRTSILETLASDFVTAARARGLGKRRIMIKHVLRNSLATTVTFIGVSVGSLLGLAVVVEQVFAIPGLGSLLVTAVGDRDFPTVQGLALVFACAVVLANLVADLTYGVIDPRVRL
jgi:peptide/nickel transport system permease protein